MSIIVYTESWNGKFRKSTFEVVSYAAETAKLFSKKITAISLGRIEKEELEKLSNYGVDKIISCVNIEKEDSEASSEIISKLADGSNTIIFSNTHSAKMIAPRLAVKLKASLITNVISLPEKNPKLKIKRKAFSSKAIETIIANSETSILSIAPNSFKLIESKKNTDINEDNTLIKGKMTVTGHETISGKVSLAEAEVVISAGRGIKGPENWTMIEELAEILGAATACSKPVSDLGWRPHSEHVGQTGKVVAPNLYIAIGISGAIQHLAGVNSSKVMVAINTDPEAPFFKAADYGIVGDAFDIVPKMIKEIKKINN